MAKPLVKSGMTKLASSLIPSSPVLAFGGVAVGYFYQEFLGKTETTYNAFADAEALRVVCMSIAIMVSVSIASRMIKEVIVIWASTKIPASTEPGVPEEALTSEGEQSPVPSGE